MSEDRDADAGAGRRFRHADDEWIARVEGLGVAGSDAIADRAIQIISFSLAAQPGQTLRRAVTPLRSVDLLFDDELCALLSTAAPVEESAEGHPGTAPRGAGRRRGSPLDPGPEDRPGPVEP